MGHFLSLDIGSSNSSVVGLALDIMLKLIAPEYSHKRWNYYGQFCLFPKSHGHSPVMFACTDQSIGCLSRATAVMLYLFEPLEDFLKENPQIVNKLSCLARDLLQFPYLKTIFSEYPSHRAPLCKDNPNSLNSQDLLPGSL